jgi:hypothetical protein
MGPMTVNSVYSVVVETSYNHAMKAIGVKGEESHHA